MNVIVDPQGHRTEAAEGSLPDLSEYDFVDFGASTGGSVEYALQHLGGTKGLGIDIRIQKVQEMRKAGYDCIEGDVTNLALPPDSVRFVVMSHFLEHLPDLATVEKAVCSAAKVATDFLFIRGPFFDADDYLRELGLKFYWSDWPGGHQCHLRITDLYLLLLKLDLKEYDFRVREEFHHSSAKPLHPLNSPHSQHAYDATQHPPKEDFELPQPVYREFFCCVPLKPLDYWEEVLEPLKNTLPIDPRTISYRV